MEARQKVMGDVPGLFEQREAINAQIREKIQERNAERDEFRKLERTYNAYLSEVRDLRGKRAKLEREEEGPPPLPFAEDLQYLENIMKYLNQHLPKEAEKEEVKKTEIPTDAAAGHMVLMNKADREEEFFYAPTKKKQLKKKGGDGKKSKPIVHSMEALSFFDKYKLPTPADSAAVPATIEAVEAKVAEFKAKQEKKIEEDKKKAEKKETK